MDSQTRVEHTLALAAHGPGDGQGAGRALRVGRGALALPVRDARREQVAGRPPRPRRRAGRPAQRRTACWRHDLDPAADRPPARRTPRTSARRRSSRASRTCSSTATAPRARSWSTRPTTTSARWCGEIVDGDGAPSRPRPAPNNERRPLARPGTLGGVSQPDLFVVCKNCGSEVSPYVTECPYCGQRVRKRAPEAGARGGRRKRSPSAAPAAPPAPARRTRSRASPPTRGRTPRWC